MMPKGELIFLKMKTFPGPGGWTPALSCLRMNGNGRGQHNPLKPKLITKVPATPAGETQVSSKAKIQALSYQNSSSEEREQLKQHVS